MSAELGLAFWPGPRPPSAPSPTVLLPPLSKPEPAMSGLCVSLGNVYFFLGSSWTRWDNSKFTETYCWGDNASQRPKIYRQIKNILCLSLLSFWLWLVFHRCLLKMSSSRRNTHKVWPPVFNCISAQTAGLEREPEPRACRFINRNEQKHINSTSHMKLEKPHFLKTL